MTQLTRKILKETRNSSKNDLWTLRKNDSSRPKNVSQYTNEHTCDFLCYVSQLVCAEALFDFEGLVEKTLHRKIFMMGSLYACSFIKKWLQHRSLPVNFANFQEQLLRKTYYINAFLHGTLLREFFVWK